MAANAIPEERLSLLLPPDPIHPLKRWLRARAYDVLSARDGQAGWRLGRSEFVADRGLDADRLRQVSESRLRRMLRHAYESTVHYRAIWSAAGFEPGPDTTIPDLQTLPFLTKDIIREERDKMVSSRFGTAELVLSHTGGTTGTQTAFHLDRSCAVRRMGRQWGAMELCGYRPGMRRALVWGVHADIAEPGAGRSLRQRFRHYAAADEVLCCTVMSEPIMREYHARLLHFRPQVLYGYPSALGQLGRFIQDHKLAPIHVSTIMTTAERLSDSNRAQLNRNFGGEVFNLYCTREYGCIAHECRKHRGLHVDTGSLYVEITREGRPVAPGTVGEITITDLMNFGMPFIRSRTGDMGVLAAEACGCGSPFPLLQSLDGRQSEVIRRPDGSVIAALMLTDLFWDIPAIRFAQFVQPRIDVLEVRVIVTPEFSAELEQRALHEVVGLVGPQLVVSIQRVADLPRNPRSGKIPEVISLPPSSAATI